MEKYSKEVHEFLVNIILPEMGIKEYTSDNIDEIVEYLSSKYEDTLSLAETAGDVLNEKQKELLQLATKAITEITTRSDWEWVDIFFVTNVLPLSVFACYL